MRKNNAEAILERMSAAAGVKTDSALGKLLQSTPSTISGWKARDSVPFAKCEKIAVELNISLDWLMLGKGAMRRDEASETALDRKEQMVLELFNALGEEDQREILHAAQEKKRFQDMMQELEALLAAHKNAG